jgi:ATP-dependent DNA helicase DinG
VIEVEVHQQLRAFLRQQGESCWPHHLTMARLVARGLRLGRSSLIQTGAPSGYHGRYRISYLLPALMWPEGCVLVVPAALHPRLLQVDSPRLQQWLPTTQPIQVGDRWPGPSFRGLLITTPEAWFHDRLTGGDRFPAAIPTLIDGIDDLEAWVQTRLTVTVQAADWETLRRACPHQVELIHRVQQFLERSLLQHPANPYQCYRLDEPEQTILLDLGRTLQNERAVLPDPWATLWRQCQMPSQLLWATVDRDREDMTLRCSPLELAQTLAPVWQQQPVILMGGAIDLDTQATVYRQRLGLGDLTCVKFAPDRQQEMIQLYLPERLPFPNTPEFQASLMVEIRHLLMVSVARSGLTVVLVDDMPLQSQVATMLAAEYGSRVQVERTCLDDNGILVSGWQFWQAHQTVFPAPQLLIMATLPIPSLEHPWVAGRVAYHKQQRQDWFRLYLLPEALSTLQRAIAPVRETQGVVALLDNRVNYRSYGKQVLDALTPMARLSYVDSSLFPEVDYLT